MDRQFTDSSHLPFAAISDSGQFFLTRELGAAAAAATAYRNGGNPADVRQGEFEGLEGMLIEHATSSLMLEIL